jgi:fatty acid desaturase
MLSVGLIHDDGLEALQEECCEHDQSVRGGRWVDVALGGLNYQIEHHLFPTMPRMNLRRAQPLVHVFCNQRGIDYAQCGLLRSYGYVLAHLHHVGASLHAQPAWAV